jgi:hypothetical protein
MRNLTPAEAKAWNEHDYSVRWKWRAILLALDAAAEARGRQQAEQALTQRLMSTEDRLTEVAHDLRRRAEQAEQARDEMKAWADAEREVASRLRVQRDALTQALKDYGQQVVKIVEAQPRIVPSDLDPEELFNRNGDYINVDDLLVALTGAQV